LVLVNNSLCFVIKHQIQKNIFLKSEKKPQILKEDKMALENFYLEDMKNLQKLLQRKLPRNWIEDIP